MLLNKNYQKLSLLIINRISPFIIEILFGIIIGIIIEYLFGLNNLYKWIKENNSTFIGIYAIIITISVTFAAIILNENDKDFIKFLIKNNADNWYRAASLFNVTLLLIGIIFMIIISIVSFNKYFLWILVSIIGINIIQIFTTIILVYNYTDIKRLFQNKS